MKLKLKWNLGYLIFMAAVLALASGTQALAQDAGRLIGNPVGPDTITMFNQAATPDQRAIFAVFLASIPAASLDTALSLSNTLQGPPGIQEVFDSEFGDLEGTLEFYLWDGFGHLIFYETDLNSPGVGLSDTGTLLPGQTYRVLLSEILAAAGWAEHLIDPEFVNDHQGSDAFSGYGWVVANFDGVQGTANVTDFSTFTQATIMQPDLGTTFWDFDANAGVPLIAPPEEPQGPGGQ